MDIRGIIEDTITHYKTSGVGGKPSFDEMVNELSETIETSVNSNVMAYHRYLTEGRKSICETKKKFKESGWEFACIEPNFLTFMEFCKTPELINKYKL